MKRARTRTFSPGERRQIAALFAFLAACIALGLWIHFSQHEFAPPSEVVVDARSAALIPLEVVPIDSGRIVRLERANVEPIRLFVSRAKNGRLEVTLAECRRCRLTAKSSRVRAGRLYCGHCGEPMPMLPQGKPLPVEADCTPIPVVHRLDGNAIQIRADDLDSSRSQLAKH